MIVVTTTEFSRNLKTMLDSLEFRGEEIILIRNVKDFKDIPGLSLL